MVKMEGKEYLIQGYRMFLSNSERMQRNLIDTGIYEWAETAIIPQFIRMGATVVDVGANIGYYSLLFSRLVEKTGHVFAFEPLDPSFERLCRNIDLNNAHVTAIKKALGDRHEKHRYRFAPTSSLPNLGGWSLVGTEAEDGEIEVEICPFDVCAEQHKIPRVGFMKIDVEGFEMKVIKGAENRIRNDRPFLMIEFYAKDSKAAISRLLPLADFIRSMNYTICRVMKAPWPHIRSVKDEDFESPVQFNAICYYDYHAVHV